ncbi:MAG TPA: acyl-homoserine-lactone synthase [Gammaproteobacteria bacterium]
MQLYQSQQSLVAEEAGFKTLCGLSPEYSFDYYHLRASVFRAELRWIGAPSDDIDIDPLDTNAVHFFTLSPNDEVIAALRILPAREKWMLEEYFPALIPADAELHTLDACEISRLAIDKEWRNYQIDADLTVADVLYKGVFQYCLSRQIRLCNMVTTQALVGHLRKKGLPVKVIGSQRMTDGLLAIMAQLDWFAFINENSHQCPVRLSWYLDLYNANQQRQSTTPGLVN